MHPNCSSLHVYLLNFHSILKMVVIMYVYYLCPAAVKIMLFITQQQDVHLMCMYRRLLATMSPLSFYVLHYGSQYFSRVKEKEKCSQ